MPSDDPRADREPIPTAPDTPAPDGRGRRIGGRYRLDERLGSGGMGTVWRAVDEVIGRTVAIKEPLVPEYLGDAERSAVHERMRREAKAAAGITHPNVVNVHDVVIENGSPWIVMELVPGRSLADELTDGSLAPERAAAIGLAVLDALDAAHRAGILHRDVKPANVLLGPDGRVVLTDFGIARIEGDQPLTHSNAIVGSPDCIAPERVNGQQPGPPSDLWSLGILLYQAVEGWSPFRRGTSLTTMLAVRDEPLPPARRAGPLTKPITALLRKDPAKRPAADEVRRALRAAAPGAAAAEPDDARPAPEPWWRRRRNQAVGGAVVAAAAAAAVLAALLPFGSSLPDGYKRYDETKMNLSIAVPANYHRKFDGGKDSQTVHYTEPGGAIDVELSRSKNDDGTDAISLARGWMSSYKEQENHYDDDDFRNVSSDKVGDSYRFHGSRAGTLDFTYQKYESNAPSPDRVAEQVYHQQEMALVGKDGWEYDFLITYPGSGEPAEEGARVHRAVRDSLDIKGL